MLKLYGFAASNYFNMVKLALLEKQLPFEVVPLHGCQNPEVLAVSARGKVPVLGTEQGFISETDVILRYLEDIHPAHPLLPHDPFSRAQVWTIAKEIELYIELPARLCYAEVIFGGRPTPNDLKAKARRDLIKGVAALAQRAHFAPYVAGEQFTVADLYFLYSINLAQQVGEALFGLDLLGEMPRAQVLLDRLARNPNVQRVAADREADWPLFMARVQAVGRATG
ncbi:glutathione S-transferase family protein [Pseudomonas sp. CDFA 602]|uniref:glutathione S-transferase family protein n=1 Tax=Pseudomonas californiensis TaxID=2829823 RepID=UPI001E4B177B|nr:glutathione S-transferase [Pseudomonas californiensis]MCD5992159.1 glutathione S-transferase family protein [Pseudomonas californiensis]MCD5997767.1 glutathione S-transferase family protein [Pseudomonas californiensis]